MTTRIERDFAFQAAVHFEGNFVMTIYELSLAMEVDTASIKEQNVAMDRILYFLDDCLGNSVFVQNTEKTTIEKYTKADIKVCVLPDEPYDQIITILLLLKLNAITEGKLIITDITLRSGLSDDVKFIYDIETVSSNPFGKKGWWLESTTSINDLNKTNKKEKIVRLVKHSDWSAVGLDWGDKSPKTTEIIFTSDNENNHNS